MLNSVWERPTFEMIEMHFKDQIRHIPRKDRINSRLNDLMKYDSLLLPHQNIYDVPDDLYHEFINVFNKDFIFTVCD